MQQIHPDSLEVVLELETFVDATETESETMADDEYDRATVNDFATRNMGGVQSCIRMPDMRAHNFEIKGHDYYASTARYVPWASQGRCKQAPVVFLGSVQFFQAKWSS